MAAAHTSVTGSERARDMAQRVAHAARRHGLAETECDLIAAVLGAALDARAARLSDDHDPAFLHPGRTALILLDDVGMRAGVLIAAGCALESEDAGLRVGAEHLTREVADVIAEIPTRLDSGDELLERLLAAEPAVQQLAVAERLDHARHLHLTPPRGWRAFHAEAKEVYLPVAGRAHAVLHRRFQWWCNMFERRFLSGGGADPGGAG